MKPQYATCRSYCAVLNCFLSEPSNASPDEGQLSGLRWRLRTLKAHPMTTLLAPLVVSLVMLGGSAWAKDLNGDGMDDAWQTLYNIAPFTGAQDPDGDGRPNLVESMNWSDPNDAAHPNVGWGWVLMFDHTGVNGQPDHIDDVWAKKYFPEGMVLNALTNPPATSPPNGIYSDPDGDGRTNFEEAIPGTNPFVADVPWQVLDSPLPESGPGSFTLHFRTVPTMSYMVQTSDNLINWVDYQQVWGDGSVKTMTIPTGTASRKFFRVSLQLTNGGVLDSDGDGLPDWYEINVFHTNPFNWDSDGDGMPDGWEAAYGLNLSNGADALADGDMDGIKNIDEFNYGLDPRHDDFTEKAAVVTYDSADHVQSVTKPGGGAVSFTYDAEGNLLTSN